MGRHNVVIIGAGIGGLSAAALLAARGCDVTVIEKEADPGGKLRQLAPAGRPIDAGPTVFTMRWVFDELFDAAGGSFGDTVGLRRLDVIARHAWGAERLDLFSDLERSADAIAAFAGPDEARHFLDFSEQAGRTYDTLERPFLRGTKTNPLGLTYRIGPSRLADMTSIRPFASLWNMVGRHFRDPRLRQLFGRYATYGGSSPFAAPATLSLIAHVEHRGVWSVAGGMHAIAHAIAGLAQRHGATFHYQTSCTRIETRDGRAAALHLSNGEQLRVEHVIFNGEPSALAACVLGDEARNAGKRLHPRDRSLSAWVWAADVETSGFPLERHNVFFSKNYEREFSEISTGLPSDPTLYVCAQDRPDKPGGAERLQIIMNAKADGDTHIPSADEVSRCETKMFEKLGESGLTLNRDPARRSLTTPADFDRLFPGSGGALYGRATHGWAAAFRRPGSRTAMPGLYLAGGATHPGAGVPMAALSGCRAAEAMISDLASTRRFHPAAIAGGMSMRSAKTGASG